MGLVPREQLVRIHASSGTRGKPTVVGYTRADLGVWSEVMARCLVAAGVRSGMVVHNAYGYGLFTGGLGVHQGAELLGATVIPMSGGFTNRQIMMMQDLGSQALACTPSYALNLAQYIREQGIDPATIALEVGIEVGLELLEGVRELRGLDVDTGLLAGIGRPLRLRGDFARFREGNGQKELRCVG